jgi:hypothetical protein
MAVAKLVCGDCGSTLAPADVRCPSCGASIEREDAPPAPALPAVPVSCSVCGYANPPGAEFCGSCGARLALRGAQGPAKKGKGPRDAGKRTGKSSPSGVGIWQIVSVVAVLGLLSYLVYLQVRGDKPGPSSSSETAAPQAGVPPGLGLSAVDLTPLENAVRESPSDPAARLRLANALHDNRSMQRAIDEYRKYLGMRPKDPDARTDLGICYFQEAQADSVNRESLLHEAASQMEEAFKSAPRPHQPSAFNLGVVYLHLSDLETSTAWFKKAVGINPESDLGKRAQNMITQHTVPQ